jgi:hypothetical protein
MEKLRLLEFVYVNLFAILFHGVGKFSKSDSLFSFTVQSENGCYRVE